MLCKEIIQLSRTNPTTLDSDELLSAALETSATIVNPQSASVLTIALICHKWNADGLLGVLSALEDLPVHITGIAPKTIPESPIIKPQCWLLSAKCDEIAPVQERLAALQLTNLDALIMPQQTSTIRFACFDMDSTLIKVEVIDELARFAGVGEQVSKITARAMRGELDFIASFTERMALLKNLPESVIEQVKQSLPLMEGAKALMHGLAARDIKTAIFSGGFNVFADHVAAQLKMNSFHANTLEIVDGALTGIAHQPVVDANLKRSLLDDYVKKMGIKPSQTLAVGDGANDLLMLAGAGIGVAFHAKPVVKQRARFALGSQDLSAILYLLD